MTDTPPFGPRLAAYASQAAESRGRRFPEPESANRTAFQRDRDRVVHCRAFRRLMMKTQVFVATEGDHYRTRLTHSLEVAQVARSVARSLGLDEDLAEVLALAHDLGHTPFGHAGEEALDRAMADWGGFDHNVQTLRILTELETRYADFDGLNLTWETLEGVVKHNGPIIAGTPPDPGAVPPAIAAYCRHQDLELDTFAGPEAQVAAISDDIAYHSHDIDDGLRAGLFGLADVAGVPLAGPAADEVLDRYPGAPRDRLVQETVRRIINRLVTDLVAESRRRLEESAVGSADDVRWLGTPVIGFSPETAADNAALKGWLFENMYHHPVVNESRSGARETVDGLFRHLMERPVDMPAEWAGKAGEGAEAGRARVVADYIAGMTDRYAMDEHRRLVQDH